MFKIGEAVKFKGAILNLGTEINYGSVEKTYIWHESTFDGKKVYFIQHNQGKELVFFITNKGFFNNDDFSKLLLLVGKYPESQQSKLKFIFVLEEDLEKIAVESPAKEKEVEKEQSIEEYKQKTEVLPNETTSDVIEVVYRIGENIPTSEMKLIAPKPKKYWYKQMAENFRINPIEGVVIGGNIGDYLVTSHNTIEVVSEKDFAEKYQENDSLVPKAIGKNQEQFLLNETVAKHIEFLEKENLRLRTELYLKNKNSEE